MPKVEGTRVGDFLKWMLARAWCVRSVELKTSTSQSVKVGSPLRDDSGWCIVPAGQEADARYIALEAVEATGDERIPCLVRGPALVDTDWLSLETGVNLNDLLTGLANSDIRHWPHQADEWDVQTT